MIDVDVLEEVIHNTVTTDPFELPADLRQRLEPDLLEWLDTGVLKNWLKKNKLSGYYKKAVAWIEEQGAAHLDEILDPEIFSDFVEAIGLKPIEIKRVNKDPDVLRVKAEN